MTAHTRALSPGISGRQSGDWSPGSGKDQAQELSKGFQECQKKGMKTGITRRVLPLSTCSLREDTWSHVVAPPPKMNKILKVGIQLVMEMACLECGGGVVIHLCTTELKISSPELPGLKGYSPPVSQPKPYSAPPLNTPS